MRVRRALARLCGRDARASGSQTYPYKPIKGEGAAGCDMYLISDGGLDCNRLDSRFHWNDGR